MNLNPYNDEAMKYKALFLDVDGTIVPYHKHLERLVPSPKTTEAIRKATEYIPVTLTTGRPYFMVTKILKHLDMKKGFAIINDGAQVLDIQSGEILYERVLDKKTVDKIGTILASRNLNFFINDNEKEALFNQDYIPEKPYNILGRFGYSEKDVDTIINDLTHIPTIKVNKTHGGGPDQFGFLISHAEATKMHGIYEVTKRLGVKRSETIGVGDSGNDFPLLMASGLKVAMGNAIDDLKEIADYIAPPVNEDGVVDVVMKYILPKK